jgi:hypothetical protein
MRNDRAVYEKSTSKSSGATCKTGLPLALEGHNLPRATSKARPSKAESNAPYHGERPGIVTAHPHSSTHRARSERAVAREMARFPVALGLLSVLTLAAFLIAFATNARAALYKWTDERGVVHYSDQMPADAVNRANIELNRQGLTVRKTEQARPVAQRLPKTDTEQQQVRDAERAKLLAERRDRALLESYTSEGEIDLSKSRALATIEGQIQSAQAFIAQIKKRRDELEAKATTYGPRPVPGEIKREIETIDVELNRQNNFVAGKQKESAATAARYDADKQRFRELHSGEAPSASGESRVASTTDLQLTSGHAKP